MLYFRNGIYQLRRRVPYRYASVEKRAIVCVSLHTDSEAIARQKAQATWNELVEAWEARLHGDDPDADRRFAAARELAQVRGYRYLSVADVARLPEKEFAARVLAVIRADGKADKLEAAALLGVTSEPAITVSKALEAYWTLARDKIVGKNEDQIRRWKNPRKRAVANFIELKGDMELTTITADDMQDFRQWWIDRMTNDGLGANAANKDITHLGAILKTVVKVKRLKIALPLDGLSVKEGEAKPRPPFSVEWIKGKLLTRGALDGLNLEARCLLLGMVNTGYRPSEAAGLLPHHIRLNHKVPHISIEPEGRHLKNDASRRIIPLVGVSLKAFKMCPGGFPTYRGKDYVSDTINKYLRDHGLLETPEHSLYGLRHSFEDRLLAAGVDERIRRDLFGHSLNRERYGEGASLEHKQRILKSIAL